MESVMTYPAAEFIYWTGFAVLIVGGWAVVAVLAFFGIEYTLKALNLTKLILGWYADKLRGWKPSVVPALSPETP